ncbi:MAG: hypothetical protein AAF937_02830 [Planctomycetota bacterium]
MWRRSSRSIIAAVALLAGHVAAAQSAAHAEFLSDQGLDDVYAEFLADQLESATGSRRAEVARELARVYVALLDRTNQSGGGQNWAERAATLLRSVPEADSPELRLGLAQAAYLTAEETAERHVLRLASERDVADAIRIFRETGPTFVALAQESHQRAQRLEREMGRTLEREEEDEVTEQLAEARRMRSIAFYYAGWTSVYSAQLLGSQQGADQALRHFGWILGARDGEAASVDQLQSSLLRFEHVSRSAIGAAIACSLSGRSIEASAWLDAVERSADAPRAIRDDVSSRRIRILARAEAWPDFDTIARRKLAATAEQPDATFARLVCVLAFERLGTPGGRHSQLIRRVASDALAYLVRASEIGHVTDLARQFGTDLLGNEGFVASYVRAVMTRDRARDAVEAHGSDDPRAVEALLQAAEKLAAASLSDDADRFPSERARAMLDAGVSLLEAGRPSEASDVFERCQSLAATTDQRKQAAWMRVVALERALEAGDPSLSDERDQAALLYLAAYPASDEAAQLALRSSTARLLTEQQAADILLSVPADAPSYAAARRRASALLYRRYRSADRLERPLIATQFLSLAESILAFDSRLLRTDVSESASETGAAMVVTARRLADVALSTEPPSIERAEYALDIIDRVHDFADADAQDLADEIAFRRLQIASHRGDIEQAATLADELARGTSAFSAVAAQVMYRDSVRAWIEDQSENAAAERVVRFGRETLPALAARPAALASVLQTVASAADQLTMAREGDEFLRIAIEMRERLVELGLADDEQTRRLAMGYATSGEHPKAAKAWLTVLQRAEPGTLSWYEARLESLRQLERSDLEAARDAANQFRALHPELGPPRYRDAFREIIGRLVGPAADAGR